MVNACSNSSGLEEAINEYRRALKVASALEDLLSEGFARIGLVDALRKSAAAPDLVADERKALTLVAGRRKKDLREETEFLLENGRPSKHLSKVT